MFYCCISAPAYCIIDFETAMMNIHAAFIWYRRKHFLPDLIWSSSKCRMIQILPPCVCSPAPPSGPSPSSDPFGLTCCWAVIIKSGCPTQERENLTNPTQHNSACKRIRVKHWAQPMTRFKAYTLAHSSSAIIIIIIIITTALYPEINQNKGLFAGGKTHYTLLKRVSEPKPLFLLGWKLTPFM